VSAICGVLLPAGHILNLDGDTNYGTVLGSSLILAAHALLVFALIALYAAQAERGGVLGRIAMVLSVLGTTLNCTAIFVEIAGASGKAVDGVLTGGLTGGLTMAGGLAFLIGLILFGIAVMRAGVFPRWAGLLLIAGDVVFGLGSFAGSAVDGFSVVGAALTCAALVWLGLSLMSGGRERSAGVATPQPA
jgi:hypothetical protein